MEKKIKFKNSRRHLKIPFAEGDQDGITPEDLVAAIVDFHNDSDEWEEHFALASEKVLDYYLELIKIKNADRENRDFTLSLGNSYFKALVRTSADDFVEICGDWDLIKGKIEFISNEMPDSSVGAFYCNDKKLEKKVFPIKDVTAISNFLKKSAKKCKK